MSKSSSNPVYEQPRASDVRHVVAWLPAAQWCTSFALWTVLAVGWVLPGLDYPLRAIAPLGLASTPLAAIAGWGADGREWTNRADICFVSRA